MTQENEVTVETPEGLSEETAKTAIQAANDAVGRMTAKDLLVARQYFEETTDGLMTDPVFILLLGNHAKNGTPYRKLEGMTVAELMEAMA